MSMTAWHITFGTYGARLHGDERPTVDRQHNRFGTPFLPPDPERNAMERRELTAALVVMSKEQQQYVESVIPALCANGRWEYVTCAAGPDHVHTPLRAPSEVHGKRVRMWLKRWLSHKLSERWTVAVRSDGMSWFCEGGSNKAVKDDEYFRNVVNYLKGQRATPSIEVRVGPGTGANTPRLASASEGAE